jgi:hypothetical protein
VEVLCPAIEQAYCTTACVLNIYFAAPLTFLEHRRNVNVGLWGGSRGGSGSIIGFTSELFLSCSSVEC